MTLSKPILSADSGRARRRVSTLLCVLGGVLAGLVLMVMIQPVGAQAAARGVTDTRLFNGVADKAVIDPIVAEIGGDLHARWTVIAVLWPQAQPNEPPAAYSESYFAGLDYIIASLHAAGVRVILTPSYVPQWASDQTLWDSPPAGSVKGYSPRYLPDAAHIADYGRLGAELARRFAKYGVVYECWNEPNLAGFLYPQHSSGEPDLAVSTYLKLLKSFSNGIRGVDPKATVIAGATAPWGAVTPGTAGYDTSTSAQHWAEYLRDNGAAAYFDAYSHHAYELNGNPPNVPPGDTSTTVTLGNIGQLLKVFPKKPFYLTEYGYATEDHSTGVAAVTEAQQANYLRQAYAMVAKRRQIKALVWYPVRDDAWWTTGLERADGTRKPAWYSFAGRNSLTLAAPASARAAESFALSGVLRGREGLLAGKRVQLQSRLTWQGSWTTLRSTHTLRDGTYSFGSVRQNTTKYYRVRWSGVCDSAKRVVRTP